MQASPEPGGRPHTIRAALRGWLIKMGLIPPPDELNDSEKQLTVLLVDEESAGKQVCGFWRSSVVLDVLHINNQDGSWYMRNIQIPQHVQSGTYELVRQEFRGNSSYFCISNPTSIST